jgi:hypothetical protein
VLMLATGCFGLSGMVFCRKDMGERFISPLNLYFAYSVVAPLAFAGSVLNLGGHGGFSALMLVVWLAFIGASIYHRIQVGRKNRMGIPWHSFYRGTSIIPLPVSAETMFKFVEPGLFLVGAVVLWKIASVVALWLLLVSLSLFVYNHLAYHAERERFLDTRDAQIEAKNLSDAIAGRPADETSGFVFAESIVQMVQKDATLRDAFEALPDDMQGVLTSA